jgi:hypothetical protein
LEILVFALFKEVKKKARTKKQKVAGSDSDSDSDNGTVHTAAPSFINRTDSSVAPSRAARSSQQSHSQTMRSVNSQALLDVADDDYEMASTVAPSSSRVVSVNSQGLRNADSEMASTVAPSAGKYVASVIPDSQPTEPMSAQRFDVFRNRLNVVREKFNLERGDTPSVTFQELMETINVNDDEFTSTEVTNQLQIMSDENMSVWWQPEQQTVLFF